MKKKSRIRQGGLWEELEGKIKQQTSLDDGDIMKIDKAQMAITCFRPKTNQRILIGNSERRLVDSLATFWEIVFWVSAANSILRYRVKNTAKAIEIQFTSKLPS